MRNRWLLKPFGALALLSGFAALAPALAAQSFDLDRDRSQIVSLDGLWRFHPGDSPGDAGNPTTFVWSQPGFDDSAWPLLKASKSWTDQGYPGMSGFGWYRFTLRIPPGERPLSLLLAPITTAYELYIDGRRAGQLGTMPPSLVPNTSFNPHLFPLAGPHRTVAATITVAIRVWHSPLWASYVTGGPFAAGHLAGDSRLMADEELHNLIRRKIMFVDSYAYSIAAGLIGVAIFFLYLFRRSQREYLWFSIILLAQAADNALNTAQQIYWWPPVAISDLLDGTLIALGLGATMAFLSRVLRKHIGLTGRTALALAALSVVAQMAYLPGWLSPSACSMTENLLLLPAQIWIFTVLIYRATRRHKVAQLLIAPTLLDVGFSMADNLSLLLAQAGLTRVPYFLEVKLPLPPFTMQPGILLHLVFLLAMLLFLIQRFSHASQREQRLAGEMEAARQVQLMLLPNAIHDCPGFTMDCVYQPAEQVGGDFFQLIALPGDELLVVVGDVSGKGLPAALMVSALVGAIRSEAAHAANPAGLLTALNHHILGHSHSGFTTALAARISATGHMTVANAGHLAPYRNGVEMEIPGSLPLGLVPDFTPESGTFQLAPGDRLTFLSDGVIEARDRQGKLLGFERARELTRLSAAQIVQAAQSFGQEDDITVLTLDLV